MNKDPILCPKCGTVFHVAPLARAAARPADEEAEVEKDEAEVVSLAEVEEGENKPEAIEIDDDVEIDAVEADDTFLEQEEGEDDDVAGLIDGDIENDEET
jgi:hypothetical protein